MINVLQILDCKSFCGITKLIVDIENNISKDIKFEYLTATNIYEKWNNLNISRKTLKGRIIYNYRLYKYLRKNMYDIIHINSGAFFYTFKVLIIAKICGIKKIVVHSHNTPHIKIYKKILIKLLNPLYRKMINVKLSCSSKASKSLYTKTKDVIILKNGIDVEKFKFNNEVREKYRKELNLENKIVYGNIGRLSKQKNHEFLIDIFFEIQKKQDAVLLLVGSGELEDKLKNKVKELNIEDKVIFLGFREDVSNILNAIDIFIFPSLYEGLPISVIEAQTNGLPVFVSEEITNEANISNNFHKLKLNDSTYWADTIIKTTIIDRKDAYKNTIKNGYDIKQTAKQLEKIYRNI